MPNHTNTALGVVFNVIASALFALMFAYTTLLNNLAGEEIYGWRMFLTFPLLTFFILLRGYWPLVTRIFKRVISERYFWAIRIVSSAILGFQLWLFLWAPGNGYGLAVSLGYFTMPIVMVIVGRFAFNDRISRLQLLASLLAVIGVLNQLLMSQTLAWPTLAVCLGYPIYFWLRQKSDSNNIGGLWFDMMLSLPISFYFIAHSGHVFHELQINFSFAWIILGLGMISMLALAFQSLSAPHLNLTLFGLLAYVEPVFLLVVALLLGETITPAEWPTYIAIWLAVMVLVIEGLINLRRKRSL